MYLMANADDEKREIILGRIIAALLLLWRFFLRFLVCSAVALAVLAIMGKPLWYAPIFGAAAAVLWTVVYRLLLRLLIALGRSGG